MSCTRLNVLTAEDSLPHKEDWRRIYRRSCHPQRFATFLRKTVHYRPSPSGAGGCFASITREDWLVLKAEEKGEHVRLDWKGEEPPPHHLLNWTTLFSYRFFASKHINILELESLISLLRRMARERIRAKRLLVLVDSRVVLGAVSKGRSSSPIIIFLLRDYLGLGVSLVTLHWS